MNTPKRFRASTRASARTLVALTTIFMTILASAITLAQTSVETSRLSTRAPVQSENVVTDVFEGQEPHLVTATSYPFMATTGVALEDMSSGTTQLVAASQDDTASPVTSIGFDFWYDGVRMTQFSVNANGLMRLGSTVISTGFTNSLASTTDAPKIGAYWEDLCTGTNGKVHYKVVGSAPNRKLVVEWQNMQITRGAGCSGTGNGTFQVWISETTGIIQFVYGAIQAGNAADSGHSVGLQSGVATNFASVTTSTNTVSYVTANNTQLNAIPTGTSYTFTPNVPSDPTGLNFTGTQATTTTLNWTDNSSNEVGFAISRSTDGGTTYSFLTQTAANATSFTDNTVSPSTTYFYQVRAVTEGALSGATTNNVTTNAAGSISSTAVGGNWSAPATWVGGVVPTANDNVTIVDGSTVTIDTAANAFTITVGTGGTAATLQYEATTARTLTAGGVTIASNGIVQSATTGTQTGHVLSVTGNLTNNGVLDLSTNTNTAGAVLTFTGATNNTLGGTGATTDLRTLTINKGTSSASVLEVTTSNFTIQGVTTDVAGFLTLTNGTLKISGTFTGTNRVFTTAAYTIGATTGFWLNNPNYTVAGQNGSPTESGMLRITQGTFNIGTATGNSMGFSTGSNITVEGGAVNATGRFGVAASTNIVTYTQTGGTITVCTIGNASTTLGSFDLGTSLASTINISGGTIVVQLAATGGAGPRDYRNQAGTGITGVTGGTLQLGNASSGTAKAFTIGGVIPNLVITNTSANHTATLNTTLMNYNNISLNITINSGNTVNFSNIVFLFAGSTLTNNGTLTHNGASSNFVVFKTDGPVSYTGSGTVTAPMSNLALQSNMGFTIDPASPNIVANAIRLFNGNVTNANKLTLGNGGATTGIVQIGNTTTATAAGTFDVPLTFNLGTGGQTISYLRTGAARSTGGEVNPTRTLTTLSIDPNGNNVTLAGGDLTVTGTMTVTTGDFTIGPNRLTLNNPLAGATLTGLKGDATSSLTLNGTTASNIPSSITNLNNLTLNNTAGSTLQANLTVNSLNLTNGALTIGARILGINGPITVGTGSLTGGATSEIDIGGSGTAVNLPAVSGGLNTLVVNRDGGLALGAPLSLSNTLALKLGVFNNSTNNVTLANGALISREFGQISMPPVFGTTVNLTYEDSVNTGPEVPASPTVLNNMTVDSTSGNVFLFSSPNVNGQLSLINGIVSTLTNTLIVRAGATVTRTNGYVDGNLARTFTAPGALSYDVGTTGVYSPVTVNAAGLTSPQTVLTVAAINQPVAGLISGQSLQRYWSFSNSQLTSATLTFNYSQTDVPMTADESQFRVVRKRLNDQRFTFPNGAADNVNEGANMATATGTTMPALGALYTLSQTNAPGAKVGDPRSSELFDFDASDGRTDVTIWNQNSGDWKIIDSVTSSVRTHVNWGSQALGDLLVPGDYDGDTRTDLAVWRASEGNWYIVRSSDGVPFIQQWGAATDKPLVGDFDGDGKTDFTIFRESEGNWYILKSGGGMTIRNWGTTGDRPVPADYDGDGKTDLAVFRPDEGNWYVINSATDTTSVRQWGVSTDVLVPSDYDGDGRADIAVWRINEGNWYILNSNDNSVTVRNWGGTGYVAVPGDYDRDGRTDIGVYNPSDSNFYILESSDGSNLSNLFSGAGDVAVASAPQQ